MKGINNGRDYFLRVDKGAPLLDALSQFASRQGIRSAALTGIGAVDRVEIGYYNAERKAYDRQALDGAFEMVQLSGNVSIVEGKPSVHAHIVVAGPDYHLRGGHLFSARVSVTAEIHLRCLDAEVVRVQDPEMNVGLLEMPSL